MMTSSNGNIFRVTGHLCGEFTGPRWIPHQWRGGLMFSLILAWINGWVNNPKAGDLRHHRAHCDVRNQESFIRGNLQYMQLTKGCIHFLVYILICVVGKTICLEQTHINQYRHQEDVCNAVMVWLNTFLYFQRACLCGQLTFLWTLQSSP